MIAVSARTHARETGGNTRYIRQVVGGLRDVGADIEVVSPEGPEPSALGWARFEAFELARAAARRGAQFIWYPADTGPVRRSKDVRTAVTLHGVGALHEPSIRRPLAGRIWIERARRAATVADTIITVSQSSADDITVLAGERVAPRVHVIPHGVAEFWFEEPEASRLDGLLSKFEIAGPFAFYFGNIEPRKNLPLAIEALERVRQDRPDLEFVVVGAPAWESEEILRELQSRPWVHYLGRRADAEIRALLRRTEFLLFPSRYEGFGLPVLEAMAAGTPVVCSTRGSLGEVAGAACFTFDDLTAEVVAQACLDALAADRASHAIRAQARARTFSWEASYAAHRALFDV